MVLLKKWWRRLVAAAGAIFLLICVLAFTTFPFRMYYGLGTATARFNFIPSRIVVLGGSGMPSEANLIRCYTAAQLAARYPKSRITIALTKDSAENLYGSSAWLMKQELVLRGVDSLRIDLETAGRSTHEQALQLYAAAGKDISRTVIVTSPEHMYRSLLTFRKAGFREVGGQAAFEKALDAELRHRRRANGKDRNKPPGLTDELQFRYQFWNHLKYQVVCYREYAALTWYWLSGRI
jgi:uncharacterized SAM-binding protein YcdF (DUF218 family)